MRARCAHVIDWDTKTIITVVRIIGIVPVVTKDACPRNWRKDTTFRASGGLPSRRPVVRLGGSIRFSQMPRGGCQPAGQGQ